MKLTRYILIIFISAFINSNAFGAPTLVNSYSVETQDETPTGIRFNADGTKMFVVGIENDNVNEYSLSVGFDLSSTVTALRTLNVRTKESQPQSLAFNSDGTVIFVTGNNSSNIDSWTLSTPYSLEGASHKATTAIGGNPRGLQFNTNGTKMFILENVGNNVQEYSLSTAYDPSTKSSSTNFSVSDAGAFLQGMEFNSNGTKMFIVSNDDDAIHEYNLSTGFNISTASYVGIYSVTYADTLQVSAITFNSDGSKMFHADFAQFLVQEYTLSCYYGVVNCMDPTSDKDDVAAIEAQTESAKKLIQHTSYPILNRMEWLRRNTNNSNLTNQNIKFQFSNPILASLSNYLIPAYLSNETSTSELKANNWSFWSEGTISVGKIGDSIASSAKNINSSAITIGADRRADNGKMFGMAVRLGNDDIDFGNVKDSLGMDAVSLTLYGTLPHGKDKFIDSLIGIGAFKTDIVNAVGTSSTEGSRDGHQIFSSIKIRETFRRNELNFTPKVKLDLGFTSLADYSENGSANLKFDRQNIGTMITSIGGIVDNTISLRNGAFKPYFEYDYFADISPSSEQKISYKSDTSSTYTLFNINSSTHNFKSKLGFDFITDTGWNLASSYQRTQNKGSGYSDALYFGASYISSKDIEYAMSLDNNKAFFDYKKNTNGFDITVGSNYSLMSEIPDYAAYLKISNAF